MTPRASIVISAYGNRPLTERCLASLAADAGDELGRSIELVLVDNGSTDDTAELFAQWSDRAVVRSLADNCNYAGGANAGAEAASGEILIFVNNDIEVFQGTIALLLEAMADESVGGVGVRLLYPDGTLQHAGSAWHQMPRAGLNPLHLFRHLPGDFPPARVSVDLDTVTGALFAMRRADFIANGAYDTAYVNGYEDMDMCLRLRLAGKRIVYRGDVAALHYEGAARGRTSDTTNRKVFVERWGNMLEDDAETIRALYDCVWGPSLDSLAFVPVDGLNGQPVSVEGLLGAPTSGGLEAIALLRLLELLGLVPAARSWHPQTCIARLDEVDHAIFSAAHRRSKRAGAVTIHVPVGGMMPLPPSFAPVLRVGRDLPPRAEQAPAFWAASTAAVEELVGAGADQAAVTHVPPPMPDLTPGPGGDGVLALLPAHDLRGCGAVLEALAGLPDLRIRLLPTVAGHAVLDRASELLPGAELLPPLTSESEFAVLAAGCDAVVSLDPADAFDRRALLAAGAGAAPVCPARGAAADVVTSAAVVLDPHDANAIGAGLSRALEASGDRAARSGEVAAACSPSALQGLVPGLIDELIARSVPEMEAMEAVARP